MASNSEVKKKTTGNRKETAMRKGTSKNVSPKQIEANRRNARQSTGPRTPQGKARARLNAMKHGLLTDEAVVQGFWVRESAPELQELRRRFFQQCAPVGPLEEMLVEQIVTCYWRKRRVLRAECGEIAVNAGEGAWERLRARAGQRARIESAPLNSESKLKLSTAGLDYMTETLQVARARVDVEGELSKKALGDVIQVFGVESDGVALDLAEMNGWRKRNLEGLKPAALNEKYRQEMLDYMDEWLEGCRYRRLALEQQEQKEEEAQRTAALLPPAEVVEKLVRYETALDRQLFRLLRQLERWQRLRMGEKLPLPLAMTGEEGLGATAEMFSADGLAECGRGLSAPTGGASCRRAAEKLTAGVDPALRVRGGGRGRGTETPPTFRRPSCDPKGDEDGQEPVAGNRRRRRERAATDLRRRLRAAKSKKTVASRRNATRDDNDFALRSDAATIKTNPNDGRGPKRKTAVSNGKMNIPNPSDPADATSFCETKPNEGRPSSLNPA